VEVLVEKTAESAEPSNMSGCEDCGFESRGLRILHDHTLHCIALHYITLHHTTPRHFALHQQILASVLTFHFVVCFR
jgi:hypothetical protein